MGTVVLLQVNLIEPGGNFIDAQFPSTAIPRRPKVGNHSRQEIFNLKSNLIYSR